MTDYQGAIIVPPLEGFTIDITSLYPNTTLSYPIDELGEEE